MGTKKYLNQWQCRLCGWNSDRPANYPAAQYAQQLARMGLPVLIPCTRPHDASKGRAVATKPCRGLMLLVGFVGELKEEESDG